LFTAAMTAMTMVPCSEQCTQSASPIHKFVCQNVKQFILRYGLFMILEQKSHQVPILHHRHAMNTQN
jgi:hypothetical protein